MAQYKVPQDVEADDKLLGPFSFRQFVYLLIAGGAIAIAVGLFQIFPVLAILPVPVVLFFAALALPLKKDQPMETYLAALVSYYLKPHNRTWTSGQKESTIQITAPKIVEESRVRNITGEEATHRLSFLANIVDTEGRAIKGENAMRDDLVAEANTVNDMFETGHFDSLEDTIARDENNRHAKVLEEMRAAIEKNESMRFENASLAKVSSGFEASAAAEDTSVASSDTAGPVFNTNKSVFDSDAVVLPNTSVEKKPVEKTNLVDNEENANEKLENPAESSIIDLANNSDFSVATIAKEAKRVKERNEGEVFISLH